MEEKQQIAVELNPFDDIAEQVIGKTVTVRVIDFMRPDRALLAGIQEQHARRHGQTDWKPTPRYNRFPHQGVRECARRMRRLATPASYLLSDTLAVALEL